MFFGVAMTCAQQKIESVESGHDKALFIYATPARCLLGFLLSWTAHATLEAAR